MSETATHTPVTIRKMNAGDYPLRGVSGISPNGNLAILQYELVTDSAGKVNAGNDGFITVDAGDTVVLGRFPAGLVPVDATIEVCTAMATGTTLDVGLVEAQPFGATKEIDDADMIFDGASGATAGKVRMTKVGPDKIHRDCNVVCVVSAKQTAESKIKINLICMVEGVA